MGVTRLDHVNIRTARLVESIAFYADALGMAMVPPPGASDMTCGAYVCDRDGTQIVHLVAATPVPDAPAPVRGRAQRGMVDHFALLCTDAQAFRRRLVAHDVPFEAMTVPEISAELIFVRDPNEVLVELHFRTD
jgi:catechol 2,3-dioxygenase-like lactoylglutathione lyase family enzyme